MADPSRKRKRESPDLPGGLPDDGFTFSLSNDAPKPMTLGDMLRDYETFQKEPVQLKASLSTVSVQSSATIPLDGPADMQVEATQSGTDAHADARTIATAVTHTGQNGVPAAVAGAIDATGACEPSAPPAELADYEDLERLHSNGVDSERPSKRARLDQAGSVVTNGGPYRLPTVEQILPDHAASLPYPQQQSPRPAPVGTATVVNMADVAQAFGNLPAAVANTIRQYGPHPPHARAESVDDTEDDASSEDPEELFAADTGDVTVTGTQGRRRCSVGFAGCPQVSLETYETLRQRLHGLAPGVYYSHGRTRYTGQDGDVPLNYSSAAAASSSKTLDGYDYSKLRHSESGAEGKGVKRKREEPEGGVRTLPSSQTYDSPSPTKKPRLG